MRAGLPLVLLTLAPACSTAEPQKQVPSSLLVEAITCKASATKLADLSPPDSNLFKGAKLAESFLDASVMIWSTRASDLKAAEPLAADAVNQIVEGKTSDEAREALRVKVRNCMPALKDSKTAGEPGNG